MVFNDVILKRHISSLKWIPIEQVPIFAGQASPESGKDEQPLYYDKTNHPIMVRNSAVCVRVCVLFRLFTSLTVTVVCRQQLQVWQVPISV